MNYTKLAVLNLVLIGCFALIQVGSSSVLGDISSLIFRNPKKGYKEELERLRAWHAGFSDESLETSGRRSLLWAKSNNIAELKRVLKEKEEELESIIEDQGKYKELFKNANVEKFRLDKILANSHANWAHKFMPKETLEKANKLLDSCGGKGVIVTRRVKLWKGYACDATTTELKSYMSYKPGKLCPDDWFETQNLIYVKNCFALPMRRCLNRTPPKLVEPTPFPASLFSQDALIDGGVRWNRHWCKSFECLNTRKLGDCRNCFNMSLENNRWRIAYRGSIAMKDVIEMKRGSLRIGLDAGGGTGSFAAHMARYNVTIMTTAMNIETVVGRKQGLPYMDTIALRGLVPLWLPHKSRLPFFDNTLDVIHCVNSIKYLPMLEFEELLFEWDRVLRVGGILWFEMFYAPIEEMPVYVAIIELLGYKKLHWNITPKPDFGERVGAHIYLNCVIEKPVRLDPHHRRKPIK